MRKAMSIAVATLTAVAVIALVAKGFLDRATGQERAVAVERFDVTLESFSQDVEEAEKLSPVSRPLPADSEPAKALPTEAELRARWAALALRWQERLDNRAFKDRALACHKRVCHTRWDKRSGEEFNEAEWELLRAFVAENADIREELLALTRPGLPAVRIYDQMAGEPTHEFEVLLSGHLLLADRDGDDVDLHEDLQALLGLSMVGTWLHYPSAGLESLRIIERVLARDGGTGPAWAAFVSRLEESRKPNQFLRDLLEVSRYTVAFYDEMPGGSGLTLREQPVLHMQMYGYRYGLTSLMNQHMTRFTTVMEDLLPLANRPYFAIEDALAQLREKHEMWADREPGFFQNTPSEWALFQIAYSRFYDRAGEVRLLDLTRLGILVEQHRRAHGVYPSSLEALGIKVPRDAYSGKPIQYQRLDEGFDLWLAWPHEEGTHMLKWPDVEFQVPPGGDERAALARERSADDEMEAVLDAMTGDETE